MRDMRDIMRTTAAWLQMGSMERTGKDVEGKAGANMDGMKRRGIS